MKNKFFDLKIQIENSAGNLVELNRVFSCDHSGTSLAEDEVPYVLIECMGNPNIIENRKVVVSYSVATALPFVSYTNIFTGYIARLDEDVNFNAGTVTFRARNALSLITQRFFGTKKHYGSESTLTYSESSNIYDIPDGFNDIYAVEVDGNEIGENNWNYDFSTRKLALYKSYSTSQTINIKGHSNTSLKTIVEDILDNAPDVTYNTIQESGTFLETCFFDADLSRYKALKQLANMFNYRLFADADGNINFNPVKLDTSTPTTTEEYFMSIEKSQIYKSITKAEVYGATITSKYYNRTDDVLDDFNDNSNSNLFGGSWELINENSLNTFEPTEYRVSYEKDNYGFKLNYNTSSGSVILKGTLSQNGSAKDLSNFTGILIKYRASKPINIFVDSAFYTLPANNYQELIEIPFDSFSGSITSSSVTNISIGTASIGIAEYFIDYIGFYPNSDSTVESYETSKQLIGESGSSGGVIEVDIPFLKNQEQLNLIAEGFDNFFSGGVTQYESEIQVLNTFADIGDILAINDDYHRLTADVFEVLSFDFKIDATSALFTYLVQEPYNSNTLNKIRNNDRISILSGVLNGVFQVVSKSGSGTESELEFSKELKELIAESKYNYEIINPELKVNSISGSATSISIVFGVSLDGIDKDSFTVNEVSNLGDILLSGSLSSVSVEFGQDLDGIDEQQFELRKINHDFIKSISGVGDKITIVFNDKVKHLDKTFFTINKF